MVHVGKNERILLHVWVVVGVVEASNLHFHRQSLEFHSNMNLDCNVRDDFPHD